MRQRLMIALLAAGILAAAGCKVGPTYHPPEVEGPAAFDTGEKHATTQPASQPELDRWWTRLADPKLDSLIQRACAANLDLRIAVARLGEARSFRYVVAADWWPGAGFSAMAGRSTGTDASRGGKVAPSLAAATDTRSVRSITQVGGFDASWELDLFGRVGSAVEAVEADAGAAAEARNQILTTIVGDLVSAYTHLRTTQRRLDIARQNVTLQEQTLDVVRRRLQLKLINELDLALAERQAEEARAVVPPLVAEIGRSQRQIAVLLGGDPQALYAELGQAAAIPTPPAAVDLGQPADLLRHRPDIRLAERQLAAATARVGVAMADFYPRVNLTGGLGLQSEGSWLSPFDRRGIHSYGPTVRWPILDFGRLDAALQVQDWRTRESLLFYRKAMQQAVQEVDDSLARFAAEQSRNEHLQTALAASKRAEKLAGERYDLGVTDFLNVLDAQRERFILEDQVAVSQEAVVVFWVSINKALGRGWEGFAPLNEPDFKQPAIIPPTRMVTGPLSQPAE